MTRPTCLAVAMIAVAASALALTAGPVLPAIVMATALLAPFVRWRFPVSLRIGLWAATGGAVVVAGLALLPNPVAHIRLDSSFSGYLLVLQVAMLFGTTGRCVSVRFVVAGLAAVACAGMAPMDGWREPAFRCLAIAAVGLAGTLFGEMREPVGTGARLRFKRLALTGWMLVIAGASWSLAGLIDPGVDAFWARVLSVNQIERAAFSGAGELDSISRLRRLKSRDVELRVTSSARPGYLRGQAFTRFSGTDWRPTLNFRECPQSRDWPAALESYREQGNLYALSEFVEPIRPVMWCQQTKNSDWIFAPLGASHFIVPGHFAESDDDHIFRPEGLPANTSYYVAVPYDPPQSPVVGRRQLLSVRGRMKPPLEELAASIFAECQTSEEKIQAVEDHFRRNYQYQLDHDWHVGMPDPVVYFLRERPPAHCEFFASAAVLLLRTAGVPCRYVTGYLAVEPEGEGRWIARGEHAHAWVEAFDDERGWVTVEPTPDAGVPANGSDPATTWRGRRGFWLDTLRNMSWTPLQISAIGIASGLVLMVWLRRRIRRSRARRLLRDPNRDLRFVVLHELLDTMDDFVGQFGLIRASRETLHEFAQRIARQAVEQPRLERAARWYPLYASCRYNDKTDTATVKSLTERLREV